VSDVDDGEPAGRINPKVFLRDTVLTEPDDAIRAFVEPMRAVIRSRPLIGVSDLMNAVLDRMPYKKGRDLRGHQRGPVVRGRRWRSARTTPMCSSPACRSPGRAGALRQRLCVFARPRVVASHAWAEAWLATRWVSFDISNARQPEVGYVRLAIGLDYLDACPVRGVRLGGDDERMSTTAVIERRASQ
jgi:hypothetical protein